MPRRPALDPCVLASALLVALAAALPARASLPELDLAEPSGASWLHAATPAEVDARIAAGHRLIAVDVVTADPLAVAACFVKNAGSYERAKSGWAHGLGPKALAEMAASDDRTLVDLSAYGAGEEVRYACVWISKEARGAAAHAGLVLDAGLEALKAAAKGRRIVSLDARSGPDGPLLSAVIVPRAEGDAREQEVGVAPLVDLARRLRERKRGADVWRVLDLDVLDGDTCAYVLEDDPGVASWFAAELAYRPTGEDGALEHPDSLEHVVARLGGARIVRLHATRVAERVEYAAVLVDDGAPVPMRGSDVDESPVLQEIDRIVCENLRRAGIPGVTLGLAKDGRLVHARGYGYADLQAGRPMEPTDMLRIASVSKSITKAALIRLMRDGAKVPGDPETAAPLAFDTHPWGEVFSYEPPPDLDPSKPTLGQLTVRQLVRHRSGLADAFEWKMTPDVWVDLERKLGPDGSFVAAPGRSSKYKNAHYHMLGHVISAVSGEPYEAYVTKRFLEPLGLRRLRIGQRRAEAPPEGLFQAVNYERPTPHRARGGWNNRGDWVLSHPGRYPASSWVASPVDILRWAAALDGSRAGPRTLDDEGWKLMGSVTHGGYLPGVTKSVLKDLEIDGARYRYFWATSSDVMERFDLSFELEQLLKARGDELPERDLFER